MYSSIFFEVSYPYVIVDYILYVTFGVVCSSKYIVMSLFYFQEVSVNIVSPGRGGI